MNGIAALCGGAPWGRAGPWGRLLRIVRDSCARAIGRPGPRGPIVWTFPAGIVAGIDSVRITSAFVLADLWVILKLG